MVTGKSFQRLAGVYEYPVSCSARARDQVELPRGITARPTKDLTNSESNSSAIDELPQQNHETRSSNTLVPPRSGAAQVFKLSLVGFEEGFKLKSWRRSDLMRKEGRSCRVVIGDCRRDRAVVCVGVNSQRIGVQTPGVGESDGDNLALAA